IVDQSRGRIVTEPSLHHFAFGEMDAGLRRGLHEMFIEAAAYLERAAEQIVAGDQRRAKAIACEGRRLAATEQAAIDDVVVEEGRGMDQFERDCSIDGVGHFRIGSAACAVYQQDERRPQPLSACVNGIVANFPDSRFVRVEQAGKFRFGRGQVGVDKARGVEGLRRRCGSEFSCLGSFHFSLFNFFTFHFFTCSVKLYQRNKSASAGRINTFALPSKGSYLYPRTPTAGVGPAFSIRRPAADAISSAIATTV